MLPVAVYLLKLSISFAVVYLFYALVLRRLTFHTWNRWYLLGYTAIAFVIPFVDISPILSQRNWQDIGMVEWVPLVEAYTLPSNEPTGDTGQWYILLLWIFGAGVAIGIARLVVQYYSFARLRRGAELISQDNIKLYHVDQPIAPFSFGDSIYVNLHQHESAELQEIIRHEFIHVKQKHTLDILFAELVCLLNWYNPFVWLIRRSIRENLEFIADRHVLQSGIDRKAYQYLLLKVTGSPVFNISHPFSYRSLKKRIVMMNKIKSARIHAIKFLFVLPMAIVTLLAFRNHVHAQEVFEVKKATTLQYTMDYTVDPDTIPAPKQPAVLKWVSVKQFLATYPSVKRVLWEFGDDATTPKRMLLFLKNGRQEEYTLTDKKRMSEFSQQYAQIPRQARNATIDGEGLKKEYELIYKTTLDNSQTPVLEDIPGNRPSIRLRGINTSAVPLVVIDEVVQTDEDAYGDLNPNDIQSVHVIKDEAGILKYGEKGRNGVILIYSKSATQKPPSDLERWDKEGFTQKGNIKPETFAFLPGLILVDGKEYDAKSIGSLNLKTAQIQSVRVLKGEALLEYGEKGAQGVTIITLNK